MSSDMSSNRVSHVCTCESPAVDEVGDRRYCELCKKFITDRLEGEKITVEIRAEVVEVYGDELLVDADGTEILVSESEVR